MHPFRCERNANVSNSRSATRPDSDCGADTAVHMPVAITAYLEYRFDVALSDDIDMVDNFNSVSIHSSMEGSVLDIAMKCRLT